MPDTQPLRVALGVVSLHAISPWSVQPITPQHHGEEAKIPRKKKERGRPIEQRYPPRTDATVDELVEAFSEPSREPQWTGPASTTVWPVGAGSTTPRSYTETGVVRVALNSGM